MYFRLPKFNWFIVLKFAGTVKELEKLPKKPVIDSTTVEFEGNVASTGVLEVKVTADPLPVVRWLVIWFVELRKPTLDVLRKQNSTVY